MRLSTADHDEDGAIAIIVALLSVVLFVVAAIVVDLGMVRITAAEAQTVADAAALAGAASLYDEATPTPDFSLAIAEVKRSGRDNGVSVSAWTLSCTAALTRGWNQAGSGTNCITFDSATQPRRIQVVTPSRRVGAAFGGLVGYTGSNVSRIAQAQARDRRIEGCSLCLSGALVVGGTAETTVTGGGSLIAGTGTVTSADAQVSVGDRGSLAFAFPPTPGPSSPVWSPSPVQALPSDPFSTFPAPVATPLNPVRDPPPCTSGDIPLDIAYRNYTVSGDCTFSGGLLVVTGTLRVTSGGSLAGSDATIYLACRDLVDVVACPAAGTRRRGRLLVDANGSLSTSGAAIRFGARDMSLICDESNQRASVVTGTVSFAGSVSCAQSTWSVSGAVTVDEGLVALDGLALSGTGTFNLSATGIAEVPGPFRVALVK